MTDRELLELAAKAAGIKTRKPHYTDALMVEKNTGGCIAVVSWNPLTDDGDALRLAVKLKLFPQMAIMGSLVGFDEMDIFEPFSPEPQAATRRAIVRAAAEIGKNITVTK